MATFTKFDPFVLALAEGKHNLSTAQLMVALSNVAPSAGNSVLADITEISYANVSSRIVTTVSSSQTGGLYKLVLQDLVLTASGAVGAWRYVILYNNTATNKELIGHWDRGVSQGMNNLDTVNLNFDGTLGVVRLN